MKKGSIHSKESIEKMRLAHIGNVATKGKKMSQKAIESNRKGHIGIKLSDETKLKMSLSHKGKKFKNRKHFSDEYKKYLSSIRKGLPKTEQHKANIKKALNLPEVHNKLVDIGKIHWNNPTYVEKQIKLLMNSWRIKPNKPETILNNLLEILYPNHWKYVGDGSFIIGRQNPDFININGIKSVIELFGDYWHKDENEQDRINKYNDFGYSCLVIWEHELRSIGNTSIIIKKYYKKLLTIVN